MQRNLSLGMAQAIAEATLAECKAKGYNTAAAVVDRAGDVLVLLRNEQATSQMLEMARRKAYTARMFRVSTREFQERTLNDPARAAQRDLHDILALSGAFPFKSVPTPSARSAAPDPRSRSTTAARRRVSRK